MPGAEIEMKALVVGSRRNSNDFMPLSVRNFWARSGTLSILSAMTSN